MSRGVPVRLGILAAILGSLTPALAGATEQEGATPAGFVAVASASDARVTYSVVNFAAVEDVVDGGGAVAQAQLDGAGNGRSFAALPFPGEVVIAGPGLFAFATGQQLPGSYPFYVAAETPLRPESRLEGPNGNYSLAAEAEARRAAGSGRMLLGDGENGARTVGWAVTEVLDDGTVRSAAESVTRGLSLGDGAVRIGAIHSTSVTTLAPGSPEPVSQSSLSIEGMTVGGTAVTMGPTGPEVAGSPLPGDPGPVREALAQAGIELTVVEAQPVDGGLRARSFEIRTIQTSPVPGSPPQAITISFGGATTAITVGESLPGLVPEAPAVQAPGPAPSPRASSPEVVDLPPGPPTAVAAPEAPSSTVTAPESRSQPVLPAASASSSPAAPDAAPTPAGGPVPVGDQQSLREVMLTRDLRHPITAFYLPLVVGAALLLGGAFAWRTRGGRSAWL